MTKSQKIGARKRLKKRARKTIVEKSLNPVFGKNVIDIPAESNFCCADGSKSISWKPVLITAALVWIGIWAAKKYKLFGTK